MPTNSTPLRHARRPRLVITDEQLGIYKKMKRLRCTCEREPYPPVPEWEECDGCREWSELNRHPAMQALVPLWKVYVVPPPGGRSPFTEQEESRRRAFKKALAARRAKAEP